MLSRRKKKNEKKEKDSGSRRGSKRRASSKGSHRSKKSDSERSQGSKRKKGKNKKVKKDGAIKDIWEAIEYDDLDWVKKDFERVREETKTWLEQRNVDGMTPLIYASKWSSDITKFILSIEGVDPNIIVIPKINPEAGKARYPLGNTAAYHAAGADNVESLKHLLAAGADLNVENSFNCTPIYLAAQNRCDESVKWLISQKVDLNAPSATGATPMYIASQMGHAGTVEILIRAGADDTLRKKTGASPLYIAAYKGHTDVCKVLIKYGKIDVNSTKTPTSGGTPLYAAAFTGQLETVKYLIEKGGADINVQQKNDVSDDDEGRVVLHGAAVKGHLNVVEYLIEKHSMDPNAVDLEYHTPLHLAAKGGHVEVCRYLLDNGAKVDALSTRRRNPLIIAAFEFMFRTVRLLTDYGSDYGYLKGAPLIEVLCCCAAYGDLELVKKCVQRGEAITDEIFNINEADHTGRNVSQYARLNPEIIEYLAEHGANIFEGQNVRYFRNYTHGDSRLHLYTWKGLYRATFIKKEYWERSVNSTDGEFRRTPLHHACHKGDAVWCQRLLDPKPANFVDFDTGVSRFDYLTGANPRAKDSLGWTPLHEVCDSAKGETTSGHVECLKLLLASSAKEDINEVTNEGGWIPIELTNDPRMIDLLRKAGSTSKSSRFLTWRLPKLLFFALSVIFYSAAFPLLIVASFFQSDRSIGTVVQRIPAVIRERRHLLVYSILLYGTLIITPTILIALDLPIVPLFPTMPIYVGLVVFLALLFLSITTYRARTDTKYTEIKAPTKRVRINFANFISIGKMVVEFSQLASLPFLTLGVKSVWPKGAGLDLPLNLPSFLFLFPEQFSFFLFSFTPATAAVILWSFASGYLGLCALLRSHTYDRLREKLFPFVRADFASQYIPWQEYAKVLGDASFGAIVAVSFRSLDCTFKDGVFTLDSEPSVVCWEGFHQAVAAVAVIVLLFFIPSSIYITLFFVESSNPKEDVRVIGLFELAIRVTQIIVIALATLYSNEEFTVFVLIVTLVGVGFLAGLSFYFQPCRDVRGVNVWRTAGLCMVTWAAIAALIAVIIDDASNKLSAYLLYIGLALIFFVFLILWITDIGFHGKPRKSNPFASAKYRKLSATIIPSSSTKRNGNAPTGGAKMTKTNDGLLAVPMV